MYTGTYIKPTFPWLMEHSPAGIDDGTVPDVLQGLQELALGFIPPVTPRGFPCISDHDLDAAPTVHGGILIQLTKNGGWADQEIS